MKQTVAHGLSRSEEHAGSLHFYACSLPMARKMKRFMEEKGLNALLIVIGRGSKELAGGKRLHVMLTIAY